MLHCFDKVSLDDSDSETYFLDDTLLARFGLTDEVPTTKRHSENLLGISQSEREHLLAKQSQESKW